jgi:hypothetical protein
VSEPTSAEVEAAGWAIAEYVGEDRFPYEPHARVALAAAYPIHDAEKERLLTEVAKLRDENKQLRAAFEKAMRDEWCGDPYSGIGCPVPGCTHDDPLLAVVLTPESEGNA